MKVNLNDLMEIDALIKSFVEVIASKEARIAFLEETEEALRRDLRHATEEIDELLEARRNENRN
jgi:hypothetical protein